jgi:hypothetical protein
MGMESIMNKTLGSIWDFLVGVLFIFFALLLAQWLNYDIQRATLVFVLLAMYGIILIFAAIWGLIHD